VGKGKRSSKRPLQEVLGQGANVNADNPLEVHDPKVGSLISYEGTTTADGAADGSTLIDAVLATKPDYAGNLVIITSGPYSGQGRDNIGDTTAGTVTPHLAFAGQILRGTTFVIAALRFTPAEVAALTIMVQTGQYYDMIYFDEDTGIPGTAWPVGTPQVPSDVIADIITMCVARNLHKISVHGALTLGAAMQHYCFFGSEHEDIADIVDLSGEDVDGSHMEGLIVTGAQAGAAFLTLVRCIVNAITTFNGRMNCCSFWGGVTSTFEDGGYIDLVDCESIYGAVTLTVQAPARASIKNWRGNLVLTLQDGGACFVRGIKGTLEIDEMTAGTLDIYANGADITINADCSGGTINIYGNARVTDNSGLTVVNDYTKETQLDDIEGKVDDVEAKLDAGGLGVGLVTKALTFANNTGQVNLFTVTGDVIVRIVAVVKTNCASGGCNVSVGIAADVDAIIPVTDITLLAAQEIWHDATPDTEIEALGSMREHIITDGNDITLNSSAADNSGAITFYCFWTALSSGATVVAA